MGFAHTNFNVTANRDPQNPQKSPGSLRKPPFRGFRATGGGGGLAAARMRASQNRAAVDWIAVPRA